MEVKILPRIHVRKITNNKPIFGALNIDAIKYSGFIKVGDMKYLLFSTKKHGTVYCDLKMTIRIKKRLIATNFLCPAIDCSLMAQVKLFKIFL